MLNYPTSRSWKLVRDPGEIERAIAAFARHAFARQRNGIVTASQSSVTHRNLIISLAPQHRLPDVYPFRYFAASGCLVSYWPDPIDGHKRHDQTRHPWRAPRGTRCGQACYRSRKVAVRKSRHSPSAGEMTN